MTAFTSATVAGFDNPVAIGSPVYNEVQTFLFKEAALLDQIRLNDWVAMLAEDILYTAPLRQTRPTHEFDKSIVRKMFHFEEDIGSLKLRVARVMNTRSAYAEDPPSRCRRLITNLLVSGTANPDEFEVSSYILMTRSRYDADQFDLMSAERRDLLRRIDGAFKLARREIILDQSALGMPNLGVFL